MESGGGGGKWFSTLGEDRPYFFYVFSFHSFYYLLVLFVSFSHTNVSLDCIRICNDASSYILTDTDGIPPPPPPPPCHRRP